MLHPLFDFLSSNIFGNILFGYFLGSIPFGLVLCFIFGYGDIRKIGSGNIGATNVLRTGNKILALLTLILDSGKGVTAFVLMYLLLKYAPSPAIEESQFAFIATVSAFSATLGHMFPVWLKFQGGKGVATAFGAMLAATPITAAVSLLIWVVSVLVSKISSLAALSASVVAPVITWLFYGDAVAIVTGAICVLVWIRHKDNIVRLMKGEEPKIGSKKKGEDESDVSP